MFDRILRRSTQDVRCLLCLLLLPHAWLPRQHIAHTKAKLGDPLQVLTLVWPGSNLGELVRAVCPCRENVLKTES